MRFVLVCRVVSESFITLYVMILKLEVAFIRAPISPITTVTVKLRSASYATLLLHSLSCFLGLCCSVLPPMQNVIHADCLFLELVPMNFLKSVHLIQ